VIQSATSCRACKRSVAWNYTRPLALAPRIYCLHARPCDENRLATAFTKTSSRLSYKIFIGCDKNENFDSVSMITRTQQEVSDIIEHFIDGTVGNWDWDDFCSHRTADPDLDLIRVKCSGLGSTHRPTVKGHFCNENGIRLMRETVQSLRGSGKESPDTNACNPHCCCLQIEDLGGSMNQSSTHQSYSFVSVAPSVADAPSRIQFWFPRPCWLRHLGHRVACWELSILCGIGGNALR